MSFRSQIQRRLLLSASTVVAAGAVLLPSGAFAAPQVPPPFPRSVSAPAPARWVETTDAPSGIKVRLPGNPEVQKLTKAKDGVDGRIYMAATDTGVAGFAVADAAGVKDLKQNLRGFLDGYNEESRSPRSELTGTAVKVTTSGGQRVLDTRLSAKDGTVGFLRLIDDGHHLVELVSLGPEQQKASVAEAHQQLLDSLRIPAPGDI
ncbi:hypothetical protein ACIPSA_15845 [Streptomyces sp. NPDC086549]|uniref:hypothetical protein n=1 Tax=Streptomyces sp. NPDC086549 TaxID=3365752 RepID=UPI0037F42A6F